MRTAAYIAVGASYGVGFVFAGLCGFASSAPCGLACLQAKDLLNSDFSVFGIGLGFILLFTAIPLMLAGSRK